MNLSEKLFLYCERGQDPAFWAEPVNALSNVAFLIAAAAATRDYLAEPPHRRSPVAAMLAALAFVIGIGSFVFHTYATRWASFADIVPIGVFMLSYMAFAMRRFLGFNWVLVALGFAVFILAMWYAMAIQCSNDPLLPITAQAGARCLNGTLGYAPALLALLGTAGLLALRRHPAWRLLASASGVFALSMTFRTIDIEVCRLVHLGGHACGTHFLWHLLNALTLYLLLRAAIRHADSRPMDELWGWPAKPT